MFPKPLRLIFIFCLGTGLIVSGIIMLVIPGPGILTILLGLSILSTEFLWAAGVMKWIGRHGKPWLIWINQCWRRMIEPQRVK
ncbi:PGPGW domain-containing protein [Planctopirus ephydatiae]